MSKIVIVTTNYWPEPTGIAVYTTDLAEFLRTHGHSVSVLTSLPHYPWWKVPDEFSHLGEGIGSHNGVSVIRVNHFVPPRMNGFIRMRFEASLWRNMSIVSRKKIGYDIDVVISCIPTVAAGIVAMRIARRIKAPFGLIIQDLSGEGAKQSGIRGGAIISKIAHLFEGMVLRGADSLVVVSPAMRHIVVKLGVPSERVTQITNYSAKAIEGVVKSTARARFGWNDQDFVVVHAGNIGTKQDLENVVKAAEILTSTTQVKFYLIGHGNQEAALKELCQGKSNIEVLPAVSDRDYSALLSAADLLLVNERSTQMEMSLPSKLTSYLFSRRPVLASVPPNGATWKFLDGIAELVEAGNPMALAQKIEELSKNPKRLNELSNLGYKFAKDNLGAEKGRQKYLDWVNALLKMKSS